MNQLEPFVCSSNSAVGNPVKSSTPITMSSASSTSSISATVFEFSALELCVYCWGAMASRRSTLQQPERLGCRWVSRYVRVDAELDWTCEAFEKGLQCNPFTRHCVIHFGTGVWASGRQGARASACTQFGVDPREGEREREGGRAMARQVQV